MIRAAHAHWPAEFADDERDDYTMADDLFGDGVGPAVVRRLSFPDGPAGGGAGGVFSGGGGSRWCFQQQHRRLGRWAWAPFVCRRGVRAGARAAARGAASSGGGGNRRCFQQRRRRSGRWARAASFGGGREAQQRAAPRAAASSGGGGGSRWCFQQQQRRSGRSGACGFVRHEAQWHSLARSHAFAVPSAFVSADTPTQFYTWYTKA